MSCGLHICSVNNVSAQTLADWDGFIEKLFDDEDELNVWSYLYDDLCAIHENPININALTTEELHRIPFLTEQQIEELEAYVYSYGPVQSLGELSLVKGLDYNTRQLLKFFLYCGEPIKEKKDFPSFKNLMKYGKNELLLRTDIPFYDLSDAYLGSNLYHIIRYKYKYSNRVEVGFLSEKDMGEPFVKGRGFDYYSFYGSLSNIGKLKKLIVGNYRLQFGMGLVLNTNFTMGKLSMLSQYGSSVKGIKPHSSATEYNYFQGVASTVQLGKFDLSGFYSNKKMDATLKENEISTLKEDGYHRSLLELSKRNNIINQTVGGNLNYTYSPFHVGITSVYTSFDKPFLAHTSGYNLYYPSGNHFMNTSLDYGYKSYRMTINGEWAISAQGGWAAIHQFNFRLPYSILLTFIHRYYDKRYNTIYGNAFSESGHVKNEHGLYTGIQLPLSERWKFSSYADIFKFPYLRYGVSKMNTKGIDVMGEIQYSHNDAFHLLVRYKNKSKQGDFKDEITGKNGLAFTMNQKVKIQLEYKIDSIFVGKTTFNYTQVKEGYYPSSRGYSIGEHFKATYKHLSFSCNAIYYHTDDYDSRVSSYEQGLLYSFSIPSFYGHGYRLSALFKYSFTDNLSLQCKYGFTRQMDKNKNVSLLNMQIRYKF